MLKEPQPPRPGSPGSISAQKPPPAQWPDGPPRRDRIVCGKRDRTLDFLSESQCTGGRPADGNFRRGGRSAYGVHPHGRSSHRQPSDGASSQCNSAQGDSTDGQSAQPQAPQGQQTQGYGSDGQQANGKTPNRQDPGGHVADGDDPLARQRPFWLRLIWTRGSPSQVASLLYS